MKKHVGGRQPEKWMKRLKKLAIHLNENLNSSTKIQPGELAKLFGLDESTLIDLKAIESLQTIHETFEKKSGDQNQKLIFAGIRQAILLCSKFGTEVKN